MYIYFHCTCIFFSGILALMFCSVNSKRAHSSNNNSCINFTNVHLCNYCTKIFVIIVNTCVCRRSVDNKALILSYPIHRPPPPPPTPSPRLITKLQSYSASCIQHLVFVILQNTPAINKTRPMAYCHCPIVQSIGQLHDDVILLQLPESLSLLSLILSRIDKFK